VDTCLSCHTAGKSPEFSEARYWPPVVHGSQRLPAGL